ncbi:hypothetical protein [Azospirillum doebereinerae]
MRGLTGRCPFGSHTRRRPPPSNARTHYDFYKHGMDAARVVSRPNELARSPTAPHDEVKAIPVNLAFGTHSDVSHRVLAYDFRVNLWRVSR